MTASSADKTMNSAHLMDAFSSTSTNAFSGELANELTTSLTEDSHDIAGANHASVVRPDPLRDEQLRLKDLYSSKILDTAPCAQFDNLTQLCQQLLGAPMASIGFVDASRVWFKSAIGIPLTQCAGDTTFCHHTIAQGEPLVVEDATMDVRFRHHPLVTGPSQVRFYAGVPLYSKRGFKVGTLAVYSDKPRSCSAIELRAMLSIALQAEALIEKHELGLAAVTDALTGIHNRRYFNERASEAVSATKRSQRPLSVIVFDVDDFKRVNDTYGHSVGDQALIAIANSVARQIRRPDVISRVGGEEFHVLLPNTDVEGAMIAAERLREAVHTASIETRKHVEDFAGDAFELTCSFGIAQLEPSDSHIDNALKRADAAMYEAKTNGKDRVILNIRENAR